MGPGASLDALKKRKNVMNLSGLQLLANRLGLSSSHNTGTAMYGILRRVRVTIVALEKQ